jgi:hypothetical protein
MDLQQLCFQRSAFHMQSSMGSYPVRDIRIAGLHADLRQPMSRQQPEQRKTKRSAAAIANPSEHTTAATALRAAGDPNSW